MDPFPSDASRGARLGPGGLPKTGVVSSVCARPGHPLTHPLCLRILTRPFRAVGVRLSGGRGQRKGVRFGMSSGTSTVRAAEIRHDWFVVDAAGQILGRLASRVARVLSGKGRPQYMPYLDSGDFVVVINAAKIVLTGRKAQE